MERNPVNQNQLQATKYQIIFPRISATEYFCQSVIIPGISSIPVTQETPFVRLTRPGDKAIFEDFTMSFIVDEDLWAWEMISDWIRCYSFPTDFNEYKMLKSLSQISEQLVQPQYSDATLTILTALNTPKIKIHFKDMFPTGISNIPFETTSSAEKPIIAQATFKYQYYTIERL